MSMLINRAAFEQLIRDDVSWLVRQTPSQERRHIADILKDAADLYYPAPAGEARPAPEPPDQQAIAEKHARKIASFEHSTVVGGINAAITEWREAGGAVPASPDLTKLKLRVECAEETCKEIAALVGYERQPHTFSGDLLVAAVRRALAGGAAPAPAVEVRGIDTFVDELLNMQYAPAGIKTVLLAFARHVQRQYTRATGADLRVRAEALYEELGGDLCICQRADVPHWCEGCQRRIDLIMTAFTRAAAGAVSPQYGSAQSSVTDPAARAMDNIPEFYEPPLPGQWSSERSGDSAGAVSPAPLEQEGSK